MKNKQFLQILTILLAITFFASCDGFEKDIDVDLANFPPKLAVTAILDRYGENGESAFSITISEGRALSDYKEGVPINRQIIRQGRITLFENDVEIFTHSGEFDMSIEGYGGWDSQRTKNGYKYEQSDFVTHAGRTYRLEVEVDEYTMVTSTSTMPEQPAITATADTMSLVSVGCVADIYSLNPFSGGSSGCYGGDYYFDFVTVKLNLDARSSVANHYTVEMFSYTFKEDDDVYDFIGGFAEGGVCISDLNNFPDNPDIEAYNAMNGILDEISRGSNSSTPDMYRFLLFPMNDNNFSRDNSLNLYRSFQSSFIPFDLPSISIPEDIESPELVFELQTMRYELIMRIRHISTATFNYYRSLAMQNTGMGFFSEPVNIAGNIENGYGVFSVYNSKEIRLLDYDVYMWQVVYNFKSTNSF